MKGTVDRIEENFAVCEMEGRVMQNIPLSAFPETAERKEEIQSLFERLKKKK